MLINFRDNQQDINNNKPYNHYREFVFFGEFGQAFQNLFSKLNLAAYTKYSSR